RGDETRRDRAAVRRSRHIGLQDLRALGAVLAAGCCGIAGRDVGERPAARSDLLDPLTRCQPCRPLGGSPKGESQGFPGQNPRETIQETRSPEAVAFSRTCWKGKRSMQVRPVTGMPRQRYHTVRRLMQGLLRWTFIVIGAFATATVLFSYIYRVNEEFYDPSLFAIGVGGLFCLLCGIMLIVLSRNSRLSLELRRARIRC